MTNAVHTPLRRFALEQLRASRFELVDRIPFGLADVEHVGQFEPGGRDREDRKRAQPAGGDSDLLSDPT